MRLAATLLLVAMAALFLATLHLEGQHPAIPWLRAFAEAGMVGGLADWFAVTALFRRPLGLPIPHTAIIPTNKDRIGDSLATFLRENFLTPSRVARQMAGVDAAGAAARWLTGTGAETSPRSREALGGLLAQLVRILDEPRIGELVRGAAAERLRRLELAPIIANAIDTTLDRGRHVPLIEAALDWAMVTLDDQQSTIRGMVKERTNWLLRVIDVDTRVSDSIITNVRTLLHEIRSDPGHPLRARLETALRNWAFDLRHFPESRAPVEAFKTDLIDNPALAGWISGLWDSAREGLARRLADPSADPSARRGSFGEISRTIASRIEHDPALARAINARVRRIIVGLVQRHGRDIVQLVSTTVRGWDATTVTEKLETAVGRDLQFIRINGTLIGGTIGLLIHAAGLLL